MHDAWFFAHIWLGFCAALALALTSTAGGALHGADVELHPHAGGRGGAGLAAAADHFLQGARRSFFSSNHWLTRLLPHNPDSGKVVL
jgi:hypothetical protein